MTDSCPRFTEIGIKVEPEKERPEPALAGGVGEGPAVGSGGAVCAGFWGAEDFGAGYDGPGLLSSFDGAVGHDRVSAMRQWPGRNAAGSAEYSGTAEDPRRVKPGGS
jgi:hypothetical protein